MGDGAFTAQSEAPTWLGAVFGLQQKSKAFHPGRRTALVVGENLSTLCTSSSHAICPHASILSAVRCSAWKRDSSSISCFVAGRASEANDGLCARGPYVCHSDRSARIGSLEGLNLRPHRRRSITAQPAGPRTNWRLSNPASFALRAWGSFGRHSFFQVARSQPTAFHACATRAVWKLRSLLFPLLLSMPRRPGPPFVPLMRLRPKQDPQVLRPPA